MHGYMRTLRCDDDPRPRIGGPQGRREEGGVIREEAGSQCCHGGSCPSCGRWGASGVQLEGAALVRAMAARAGA